MELPENKLTDFIEGNQRANWRPVNNHNIKNFTEDEIKRITNNYSAPIGKGGFGQVYQGALEDGTIVAVKKYICQNKKEDFAKEITAHCQIKHKNVVRLLGYCSEENALMIVTEYVPGGNLKGLLHGNDAPISLDARLRIAIECADALGYMHSSMYQPIIHGDIKPDNILLDNNLGAKLSDFGLSRLVSMDQAQFTMTRAGSRCYMAPEIFASGLVDPKNDVYSFGVVLLELITRSEATGIKSGFSAGLKRNFTDALRKGKQEAWKMFDSEIANGRNIDILDGIGSLAAECIKEIRERPQMKDVQERLQVLRRALNCAQAQEKTDQGSSLGMLDTTEMVGNNGGKNISSTSSKSSVRYKLSILDIFSKNARRYKQNAGPILERIPSVNIFTKSYLKIITRNYSQVIGMGFTYRGHTKDNNEVVVKKFFNRNDRYDVARVMQSASSICHKNIIRLVGCCLETEVPLLVYEFAHSSLWELLHGNDNARTRPSLKRRLDIAIGSAEALAYLHSVTPTKFVHGNITSRNILLDYDFVPKVQNAVFFPEYVYPNREYMGTPGIFTAKSDVFSYGVVLLELITGKRPHKSLPPEYIENGGEAMFDKEIAVGRDILILEEIGNLATQCLSENVSERPEMVEVVEKLQNLRRDYREQSRDRGLHRNRSFH